MYGSINMRNVKAVILVLNILKLMKFLHHNARSLLKRYGPINMTLSNDIP
jgi:hypothetical protein